MKDRNCSLVQKIEQHIEETKYQSHPLAYVVPKLGLDLICHFENGEVKIFNFKQVVERYPEFKALENDDLFFKARVDLGGLCVTFNDELDISEETLYQEGNVIII